METSFKKTLSAEQIEDQQKFRLVRDRIKKGISDLVEKQKEYKGNRKQLVTNGRKYSQGEATSLVSHNGKNLRHHYIAYAQFRGKRVSAIERNPNDVTNRNPFYQPIVDKILDNYGAEARKTVRYNP